MHTLSPRPLAVTITLWGVFLLGVWNMGRVVAIIQQSNVLSELNNKIDPRIRLVAALLWALWLGGMVIALRQRRPFTRRAIPITLLLYAVYELSLTITFAQNQPAQSSWRLNGLFYLVVIIFSTWALNRTAVTPYFEKEKLEVRD
jgi:hypothetical protein